MAKRERNIPPEVRAIVERRSLGKCEARIGKARCWGTTGHLHHRKFRSRGGQHTVENLIDICPACHEWIHDNGVDARENGWAVPAWEEPANIAVMRRGRFVFLEADGDWEVA